MRVLGIDYGTKRIGIAIGDTETKVSTPFSVVNSWEEVEKIINSEKIELAVVGMPYRMDGSPSEIGEKVKEFIKNFKIKTEIQDERFTTFAIEKLMKGYGDSKKGIDKDSAAASLILQTWLDKL